MRTDRMVHRDDPEEVELRARIAMMANHRNSRQRKVAMRREAALKILLFTLSGFCTYEFLRLGIELILWLS